MKRTIDLNCDLGEAFGNYPMPADQLLMDYITSANIACGYHAGDPAVMQQTVKTAIEKGVAIGAHPGLPDLQGFGRRELKISANEAYQITLYQIGALHGFVKAANGKLNHVKLHGAFYNMAAKDLQLSNAVVQAICDFDQSLILYALSGSKMIEAANQAGLQAASEVFADRSYQDDGSLTPRTAENALISSDEIAWKQVLRMVKVQEVVAVSGKSVQLKADTICLHGDGVHAIPFAKMISEKLKAEGIILKSPGK